MKRCLDCGRAYTSVYWRCPHCGSSPPTISGFRAFAPRLAAESADFPTESHDALDQLQAGSFWFRARNRLVVDLIRRHAPAARSVMEIGCGSGFVLAGVRRALPGVELVGSEIQVNGLGYARCRLGPDVTLVQMDARAIPYDEEFDVIGAFDVLEHIEEDRAVLTEMRRALRPGGHVILTVPQHPMLWSATDEYAHHKRRYRRAELRAKVSEAGLLVRVDTSFVVALFPAMLAQRLMRGRRDGYEANVELTLPRWMDRAFEVTLDAERALIARGLRFPVGGSRVVVAQRPPAEPRSG